MYSQNRSRRGVILIVVLGMLALFALMAVTFVIVARQSRMSSLIDAKLEQVGDPPEQMLDAVVKQLIRGTHNPYSSLRHVSLLEDMYGNDEVLGRVKSVPQVAGTADGTAFGNGKIIEFSISPATSAQLSSYYGYYNGLVLTMSGGAADGQSTRIIDYDPAHPSLPFRIQVLAFENGALPAAGDLILINGRPFNGTGYGYARGSFDTSAESDGASFLLDAFDQSQEFMADFDPNTWDDPNRVPYALLTNPVFFTPTTNNTKFTTYNDPYDDPAGPGGADEDYDVPDFQNLLLGAYVWNDATERMDVHIPSLHRPALVRYWIKRMDIKLALLTKPKGEWNNPDNKAVQALRRKIVMRPSSLDHFNNLNGSTRNGVATRDMESEPDFTGRMGALEFDPTSTDPANFDVDNDGDGVPDSVWIDAGLPVQSGPGGRLVKPLVAVLCIDLDSKINLNAHGTIHHADAAQAMEKGLAYTVDADRNYNNNDNYQTGIRPATPGFPSLVPPYPQAGPVMTDVLPVGQGFGPAEINPAVNNSLFDRDPSSDMTPGSPARIELQKAGLALRQLLVGAVGAAPNVDSVPGRYGEIVENGFSRPGMREDATDRLRDFVHEMGQWDMPDSYWSYWDATDFPDRRQRADAIGQWGSPPDMNGNGAIAYDLVGQPVYVSRLPAYEFASGGGFVQRSGMGESSDNVNDPYEINLSLGAAHAGYVPLTPPDPSNPLATLTIDAPFSVYELERILRYHDPNVRDLPDRIVRVTEPLLGARPSSAIVSANPSAKAMVDNDVFKVDEFTPLLGFVDPEMQSRRRLVTTHSFDLPTYNLSPLTRTSAADYGVATGGDTPKHLLDLLAARIRKGEAGPPLLDAEVFNRVRMAFLRGPTDNTRSFESLLAPQLLSGLRMDINRAFGNGRDDSPPIGGFSGRGVVDEPREWSGEEVNDPTVWDYSIDKKYDNYRELRAVVDPENDGGLLGPPSTDLYERGIRIRQRYARHLYVLARLVLNEEFQKLAADLGDAPGAPLKAARRFAQWAINVVDYRDADSIMTPFAYDINPFGNGILDDSGPDGSVTWNAYNVYVGKGGEFNGVVWGMERPELLITETFAFHNRNTEDAEGTGHKRTDHDKKPDDDFDQFERPEGSLFVELYNPTGLSEHMPAEFYELPTSGAWTNGPALRLDKVVLDSKPGGGQTGSASRDPIWRLAITDGKEDVRDPHPSRSGQDSVLRTVYFTGSSLRTLDPNVKAQESPQAYHATTTGNGFYLPPQHYAIIGPDNKTNVKDLDSDTTSFTIDLVGDATHSAIIDTEDNDLINTFYDNPSYPRLDANVNDVDQTVERREVLPVTTVVIDKPSRLSISQPYDDYAGKTIGSDEPWDDEIPTDPALTGLKLKMSGTDLGPGDDGVRRVHLQRLADPTRSFHAVGNPYLTVDSLAVDLTVYNGRSSSNGLNESDVVAGVLQDGQYKFRFSSRQRDGVLKLPVAAGGTLELPNLWSNTAEKPLRNEPADHMSGDKQSGQSKDVVIHTLGYLNRSYYQLAGLPGNSSVIPGPGYVPEPLTQGQVLQRHGGLPFDRQQDYIGAPPRPFTSFIWPNRPFISNTELMNVPWAGPSEMFSEYSSWMKDDPTNDIAAQEPRPYTPGNGPDFQQAPHRHLPNFFHSDQGVGSGTKGVNLHRLLEFVHVPSRFAGTKEMLPPGDFVTGNHTLHPPFNFLSRYRDPGRVNLNTIFDNGQTLRAIMNGTEQLNASWDLNPGTPIPELRAKNLWARLIGSRRGDGVVDPTHLIPNPNLPTFFANPFRSYSGGNLVPIAAMKQPRMVDSTLLRPDPAAPGRPLFTFDPDNPLPSQEVNQFLNGDTNANVRNLVYQKLGNMVTTRSNVYAIWITMGYFEVEAVDVTISQNAAAYPDGYRLKQELGTETGEIERHRSFYIIDRTIPVGFIRGEDTNIEKTILLRRFIE